MTFDEWKVLQKVTANERQKIAVSQLVRTHTLPRARYARMTSFVS
jgi:hypothetical protein